MNQKPLIFLGSNFSISTLSRVCEQNNIKVHGILDNDYWGNTEKIYNVPVVGSEKTFDFEKEKENFNFFIAVSSVPNSPRDKERRLEMIDLIDRYNLDCPNLIHPVTEIIPTAKLGKGIFIGFCVGIGDGCVVQDHCQLFHLAGLAHHSELGRNSVIERNASVGSKVKVGRNVNVGFRSGIFHGVTIGDNSIIMPGVTVARDVEENEIVSLAGDNKRRIYGQVVRS